LLTKLLTAEESCDAISACTDGCPSPPSCCSCYAGSDGANKCQYSVCLSTGTCIKGGGIYIKAESVRIELGTGIAFVEGNRFVSTTVFIENNIAYVKKEATENILSAGVSFYNLANVQFTIDAGGKTATLIIPEGSYYWFIPFGDVPPFILKAGVCSLDC